MFHIGFYLYGQENLNFELEKLRIELRHARGMFAIAQSETNDASVKVNVSLLLFYFFEKHNFIEQKCLVEKPKYTRHIQEHSLKHTRLEIQGSHERTFHYNQLQLTNEVEFKKKLLSAFIGHP